MPYDTYRLHQIERVKSPAEVRRADEQAARLAAAPVLALLLCQQDCFGRRQSVCRHVAEPGAFESVLQFRQGCMRRRSAFRLDRPFGFTFTFLAAHVAADGGKPPSLRISAW